MVAARSALLEERHIEALEAGHSSMKLEKMFGDEYQQDWKRVQRRRSKGEHAPSPKRMHVFNLAREFKKPQMPLKQAILETGKVGYNQKLKELKRRPAPDRVSIELSRTAILRFANLSCDGKNLATVDKALCRLIRPVALDGDYFPPLIINHEHLSTGTIKLAVDGEWLPHKRFCRLPLPLPTRSPQALALGMFLRAVRVGRLNDESISLERLCHRIGIDPDQPRYHVQQALDRALDVINRNLARFDADSLGEMKMPGSYRIAIVDDGRIKFEGRLSQVDSIKKVVVSKTCLERVRVTKPPTATEIFKAELAAAQARREKLKENFSR